MRARAAATFRGTLGSICAPFLLGPNGERIGYVVGLAIDALAESTREAVRAWFPGRGPPEALPHIGRDRGIDRGPRERGGDYAERLRTSMVALRQAGSAARLLQQLRHYWSPVFDADLSFVSDRGVWHTIDMATGVVTKTEVSPSNWQWDPYAAGIASAGTQRWRRGWLVLENTQWSIDTWSGAGPSSVYDNVGTWGSDATIEEVTAVRRLVERFRSAGVHIVNIIVSFTPGLYAVGNAPGAPMPDGDHHLAATRVGIDASFWIGAPK